MNKDWNFDEVIDRSNTNAMKWEPGVLTRVFGQGREDLLPLWVADMDFKCPTPVRKAMEARMSHQIYGYTITDSSYYTSLISWYQRRHHWSMKEEWILTTPGVVPAITYVIQCFTNPGDKVLIQPPVYYPFARSIVNNGRCVQENPLKIVGGRYEMDFDNLRTALPRQK
jgi:cystathionine beta-lyase